MEVKAITGRSEYVFTRTNGEWILFRHNRSYYHITQTSKIRKGCKIRLPGKRYDPLLKRDYNSFCIESETKIKKILINGKEVNQFIFYV